MAKKLLGAFRPHERVLAPVDGVSRTRQEFKAECDINTIMRQYSQTGVLSHVNRAEPRFMDFSNVPDLATSLSFLMQADEAFMSLPAVVRREFDNDARKFVEFAENSENLDQLRSWGLAKPIEAPPPPMEVRVVDPSPAPPAPPKAP